MVSTLPGSAANPSRSPELYGNCMDFQPGQFRKTVSGSPFVPGMTFGTVISDNPAQSPSERHQTKRYVRGSLFQLTRLHLFLEELHDQRRCFGREFVALAGNECDHGISRFGWKQRRFSIPRLASFALIEFLQ